MGEEGGLHRLEELQRRAETRKALNTAPAAAAPAPASAAIAGPSLGASSATAIVPAVMRSCSASITITVEPANTAPARSVRFLRAGGRRSGLGLDHLEVRLARLAIPRLGRALRRREAPRSASGTTASEISGAAAMPAATASVPLVSPMSATIGNRHRALLSMNTSTPYSSGRPEPASQPRAK